MPFCGLHVLPECDYVDVDFAEFCVGRLKGSSQWEKVKIREGGEALSNLSEFPTAGLPSRLIQA